MENKQVVDYVKKIYESVFTDYKKGDQNEKKGGIGESNIEEETVEETDEENVKESEEQNVEEIDEESKENEDQQNEEVKENSGENLEKKVGFLTLFYNSLKDPLSYVFFLIFYGIGTLLSTLLLRDGKVDFFEEYLEEASLGLYKAKEESKQETNRNYKRDAKKENELKEIEHIYNNLNNKKKNESDEYDEIYKHHDEKKNEYQDGFFGFSTVKYSDQKKLDEQKNIAKKQKLNDSHSESSESESESDDSQSSNSFHESSNNILQSNRSKKQKKSKKSTKSSNKKTGGDMFDYDYRMMIL